MTEVGADDVTEASRGTVQQSGWVQIGLAMAALVSMVGAGLYASGGDPFEAGTLGAAQWGGALAYAGALMAIILAHEAGHYVMARRVGMEVSRPYLLPGLGPLPGLGVIPFFGTFGAFIKMGWTTIGPGQLVKVAGWGPIAGFIPTAAAVVIGIYLSEPVTLEGDELMVLGDSLIMAGATELFHPDMKAHEELYLHPIGLAGWVGCLLTALNLLPMGQLDGGHLVYAYGREKARWVSRVLFGGMLVLGMLIFPGWLILGALIWWLGLDHPPVLKEDAAVDHHWIPVACAVIFVLTFTPQPVVVDALPQWLEDWF